MSSCIKKQNYSSNPSYYYYYDWLYGGFCKSVGSGPWESCRGVFVLRGITRAVGIWWSYTKGGRSSIQRSRDLSSSFPKKVLPWQGLYYQFGGILLGFADPFEGSNRYRRWYMYPPSSKKEEKVMSAPKRGGFVSLPIGRSQDFQHLSAIKRQAGRMRWRSVRSHLAFHPLSWSGSLTHGRSGISQGSQRVVPGN